MCCAVCHSIVDIRRRIAPRAGPVPHQHPRCVTRPLTIQQYPCLHDAVRCPTDALTIRIGIRFFGATFGVRASNRPASSTGWRPRLPSASSLSVGPRHDAGQGGGCTLCLSLYELYVRRMHVHRGRTRSSPAPHQQSGSCLLGAFCRCVPPWNEDGNGVLHCDADPAGYSCPGRVQHGQVVEGTTL